MCENLNEAMAVLVSASVTDLASAELQILRMSDRALDGYEVASSYHCKMVNWHVESHACNHCKSKERAVYQDRLPAAASTINATSGTGARAKSLIGNRNL